MTNEHVRRIHADAMVIDAHADIEVPGKESPYVGPDGRSKVAPDKMARGGVDGVVLSVAAGPGPRTAEGYARARRVADRKLAAARELIADSANNLVLARTANDADEAKKRGKRCIFLSFQNTQIIGTDLTALGHLAAHPRRVRPAAAHPHQHRGRRMGRIRRAVTTSRGRW